MALLHVTNDLTPMSPGKFKKYPCRRVDFKKLLCHAEDFRGLLPWCYEDESGALRSHNGDSPLKQITALLTKMDCLLKASQIHIDSSPLDPFI